MEVELIDNWFKITESGRGQSRAVGAGRLLTGSSRDVEGDRIDLPTVTGSNRIMWPPTVGGLLTDSIRIMWSPVESVSIAHQR